jgi:hypothetical protein
MLDRDRADEAPQCRLFDRRHDPDRLRVACHEPAAGRGRPERHERLHDSERAAAAVGLRRGQCGAIELYGRGCVQAPQVNDAAQRPCERSGGAAAKAGDRLGVARIGSIAVRRRVLDRNRVAGQFKSGAERRADAAAIRQQQPGTGRGW